MNAFQTKLFPACWRGVFAFVLVALGNLVLIAPLLDAAEITPAVSQTLGTGLAIRSLLQSYLIAYLFWLGIALGCLGLALLHQLVHGTWGLATSRIFEAGSSTLPLLALLFVPIALGVADLYPWAGSQGKLPEMSLSKAAYLSPPGFNLRAAGYFACWLVISMLINRWSRRRDAAPDDRLTQRMRRLSGGGLALVTLTVTFASFDWMMSLEPHWYSTMYGALYAMGSLLTSFSFSICILARRVDRLPWNGIDTNKVFVDLGSLLLAFVILWTYLAYSQYLIIWSGNTTEEIPWYLKRLSAGWQWLALVLVLFHFAVPFMLLLSHELKRRPRRLAWVAAGLVAMGYLNLLWMIKPAFELTPYQLMGTNIEVPPVGWLDFVLVLGLGAVWMIAFTLSYNRRAKIPPNDPAWENVEEQA